jgi:predicted branched-subunit amino acid permease
LPESSARAAWLRGARDLLAPSPGIFAWGLVTGVAMVKSGLSTTAALVLSIAAYAGSAQLAAMPLIATLTPPWIVLCTATIVNLRFVVYAAMLRGTFAPLPAMQRLWLGYFVGDVTFVKYVTLTTREPDYPHRVAYYVGASACNWAVWQVSSIIGILAADSIPSQWGLELAGTLALVALVVPLCAQAPARAGVLVSGVIALLARGLPLRLGLLCAVIGGIGAALWVEARAEAAASTGAHAP